MRNRAKPPGGAFRRKPVQAALYGAIFALAGVTTAFAGSTLWHGAVHPPKHNGEMFPPWQQGRNNDAVDKGFVFTVPEVDDVADFHGDVDDPKLVLYIGGNYSFAVAPLVRAFEQQHPRYSGKVLVVTIPPGLLIKAMKADSEALAQTAYHTSVKDGRTILTHIHHRQTPLFLVQRLVGAGITWKSEALFQEQTGHPISNIDLPPQYNTTALYGGAMVKGVMHPAVAQAWLAFIHSPSALHIFERSGFEPHSE